MEKLLGKAIEIAAIGHSNKFDKGGNPYILHPLWVMENVRDLGTEYMVVAVLHDLIEDTNWTLKDLREVGFPHRILESLNLLDFRGKVYEKQIELLSKDKLARQVKIYDLKHNMDVTRLSHVGEEDLIRLKKYKKAYKYLMNIN